MFPDYYGSPFIFKESSLASSMEYYYSVSGLLLNLAIWSLAIFAISWLVTRMLVMWGNPTIGKVIYKGVIIILILFSSLIIAIHSILIGRGFQKGLNYWYMEMDKEAKSYGLKCEGKLSIFHK